MIDQIERLERQGWHFDVSWLPMSQRWCVYVWRDYDSANCLGDTRAAALTQALQFATLLQEEKDDHAA